MSNADALLDYLGYDGSPCFLQEGQYASYRSYSHVFRQARGFGLRGVYTLREKESSQPGGSLVPLVYVCEAEAEEDARKIYRKTWNQNVVPFLLVATAKEILLYSGFSYPQEGQEIAPLLRKAREALEAFDDFSAKSVDEGRIWGNWRLKVTPERRVDWSLLGDLEKLGELLRGQGLSAETAHALIGKYVYLQYLKDRDFLSDRKFTRWHLDPKTVFGPAATLAGLRDITEKLDGELNGSVFPLPLSGGNAPPEHCVRKVAAVFAGEEPGRQQRFNFSAYNFEHIPTETLSVVYQQFLHAEGKGREKGAYYTPLHLVNFILDEMDARKPLSKGMKVLDPACGSGAFLVQCYRRLIERELAERKQESLAPGELRCLLTDHFFGVEKDGDACSVAELSLILTLLDYVRPPDLESWPTFRLPILRDRNVFKADFFQPTPAWEHTKYDWIVGNPPWKPAGAGDEHAAKWMEENASKCPVDSKQMAEAFAWKAADHLAPEGQIGLLLPAMTLFKAQAKQGSGFRCKFFGKMDVRCVANFAHLVQVLFARRSGVPAAAFFYKPVANDTGQVERKAILSYAPFVVNQEANRSDVGGRQQESWSVVVNASEIREMQWDQAVSGKSLPWKLAMWGTQRDRGLLERVTRRFPAFSKFRSDHGLSLHEGIQLRTSEGRLLEPAKAKNDHEPLEKAQMEFIEEIVDKYRLEISLLRGKGRIYDFPTQSLVKVKAEHAYVRKRGGKAGLEVCRKPHIILDSARRFAVFSDRFIVVPARQLGIAGQSDKVPLLKALSVFLASDFAKYHQFLVSPQWGIEKSIADKTSLEELPVPLADLPPNELHLWAGLQELLAVASLRQHDPSLYRLGEVAGTREIARLEQELNKRVYHVLGLRKSEQWLVEDLVHTRLELTRGKTPASILRPPTDKEMTSYGDALKSELDGFMAEEIKKRHFVTVLPGSNSAVIKVRLKLPTDQALQVEIRTADEESRREFRQIQTLLREQRKSQWLYFDRGLRIYDASATYLFKPLNRLYWLRSQALADADEIIADNLTADVRAR